MASFDAVTFADDLGGDLPGDRRVEFEVLRDVVSEVFIGTEGEHIEEFVGGLGGRHGSEAIGIFDAARRSGLGASGGVVLHG